MKFIFIGGCMHSGTTMLQKILSKHSSILGVPSETRLLEYWVDNKNISKLEALSRRIQSELNSNSRQSPCIKQRTLKAYWQCHFMQYCVPYVVEKTPTNVYFTQEILESFGEDALVILIYRSPFQVLASKKQRLSERSFFRYSSDEMRKKKRLEKDFSVYLDCLSWNKAYKITQNEKGKSQIHVLDYSEFVLHPESQSRKIFRFLDLDFEPEVLMLSSANSASLDDIKTEGISAKRLDKYKMILSRRELAQVSFLCRKQLRSMDHELYEWSFIDVLFLYAKAFQDLIRRVFKRFKMYSFSDFLLHGRNYLKRLTK